MWIRFLYLLLQKTYPETYPERIRKGPTMARSFKLTWQGESGRSGRWKKQYKGKFYYFPGGTGKSDRNAYFAALEAWEQLKVKIDATAPRKYQQDYEKCIDQWEQVLAWCNQHGDKHNADQAAKRIAYLRRKLTDSKLSPLKREDWLDSNFDLPAPGLSVHDDFEQLRELLAFTRLDEETF